eukprot:298779-Heterocapsa_arctica.AAC.1
MPLGGRGAVLWVAAVDAYGGRGRAVGACVEARVWRDGLAAAGAGDARSGSGGSRAAFLSGVIQAVGG